MGKKSIISGSLSFIIHLFLFLLFGVFTLYNSNLGSNAQKNAIQIEFTVAPPPKQRKENLKEIENKKKEVKKINKEIKNEKKLSKIKSKNIIKKKKLINKKDKNEKKDIEQKEEKGGKLEKETQKLIKQKKQEEKPNKIQEIDKRAIYNTQVIKTKGGGAMLEMKGWTWDNIPKPNDSSDEVGKIVFKIIIDDFGEIINIKTLERTVSLKVEAIYREALEMITFSRTSNKDSKGNSIGKITFFIRYK